MANPIEKKYLCSEESYISNDQPRGHKNLDMVLNLDTKPDAFLSDLTPTPIRLLQKCEEMGLFQDMPNVNPFEETFRKAAEDIRAGATPLEISSLTVTNNSDDSLHTPHVIFPLTSDTNRRKGVISPGEDLSIPILHHDPDPLCISLDDDEADKSVVQQEADTSEETQMSDVNTSTSGCEDENNPGTIQFLLRMPNGKMVKLSSLPVEQMVTGPSGSKDHDIPVIKVDSSFLKTVSDGSNEETSHLSSSTSAIKNNSLDNFLPISITNSNSIINSIEYKSSNQEKKVATEPVSGMSLAKLKLKQALMNNSCPASNLSSSFGISSSSVSPHTRPSNTDSKHIETRRLSSQSDESEKYDDLGRNLSSVEEKRRRNRAAAMRCREKRKTWVKELERRANEMLKTNGQLQHEVSMLRDEVAQLKTLLLAHRDCPVTQALVQGKVSLPSGSALSKSITGSWSQSTKRTASKDASKSSPDAIVLQTASAKNPVKPVILLNDPPVKRKRLNSATVTPTSSPVSAATPQPSQPVLHTVVLPPKTTTTFSSSFVNVIPSVLVANSTPASCNTVGAAPQIIYSQILPMSTIPAKPGVTVVAPRQTFILPKSQANSVASERHLYIKSSKTEGKPRSTHLLSTNVIKLNPNVMERDSNDSDIEILDVKPIGS